MSYTGSNILTDATPRSTLFSCYSAVVDSTTETLYHYVIVRTDLPKGLQAAQIVHAAGESSPGNLSSGTHAVVLAVPNEEALLRAADVLEASKVAHVVIYEPDAPWKGAAMAIGIVPGKKEVLKRALSSLPLLR